MALKGPSSSGRLDIAAMPVEQFHSELPLQVGDLLAEERLRVVEPLRRCREVQGVGHR
jgi:hypothetical protein